MSDKKPIKRHDSLKELSRDHHFGLLLCWKIKQGLKKNVPAERIKKYTDYFFNSHLLPHFSIEESIIFPLLDESHPLIRKALSDHQRLKDLFEEKNTSIETLSDIVTELEEHIRFEERELFNELQKVVSPERLKEVEIAHNEGERDIWEDEFWK
jgi:hemerythrin-like domain-containing protein